MGLFHFKKNKSRQEKASERRETTVQIDNQTRKLSYVVANLQGIGTRERQEDAFAFVNVFDVTEIQKNGLMFIVADGMGGMRDGKLASETAVASMKEAFQEMDRSGDLALQLQDAVFESGSRVIQVLGGDGGSTIVVGVLYQEQFYFASVGDSFLYLKRDGQLYRMNQEHNLQNQIYLENIRSGNMDLASIESSPEAAALTQFLGMDGMDEVDFLRRPFPLREGDIFLACSDGVGGVLSQQTILTCMESGMPQDICHALEREILEQGRVNQDNYTALVITCTY